MEVRVRHKCYNIAPQGDSCDHKARVRACLYWLMAASLYYLMAGLVGKVERMAAVAAVLVFVIGYWLMVALQML